MSESMVPASLGAATREWFSQVLASAHPGVQVETLELERVIHGTATKAKFHLSYNDAGKRAGLPPVMWLKSPFEAHTEVIAKMGIYLAEGRFYRDLRPRLPVNAPRTFFTGLDEARGVAVVLMEDFEARGATLGYATRPASVDQVASTLEELARMHAHWWRSRELDRVFPPPPARNPGEASPFDRYREPEVIEQLLEGARADGVPRHLRDPAAMSRAVKVWQEMQAERICFMHGDSHYGNVFYDPDGASGHYDWQNYHCGHWCHDVSYFMGTALRVRDRERSERDLVQHYVDCLRAGGVDEISFDAAWLTYRQFLIYGLWIFLANWEEMQPFEVNATYVTRFAAAVSDHDTYGLLAKARETAEA